MTDTADRVKKIMAETLGVDHAQVTTESHVTDDLGADSLDHIELIMEFEDQFGIEISDDEGDKLFGGTVQSYVDLIDRKRQAGG